MAIKKEVESYFVSYTVMDTIEAKSAVEALCKLSNDIIIIGDICPDIDVEVIKVEPKLFKGALRQPR